MLHVLSDLQWLHPGWLVALAGLLIGAIGYLFIRPQARQTGRPLRWTGLTLLAALLFGALAEPCYRYDTPERFTLLLVDRSASIRGPEREWAAQFVARCRELAGAGQVAVLPFAGRPGAVDREVLESANDLEPLASNPGRAVLAAAAQLPADRAAQIVLISDGLQTTGDLQKAAVGAGVPISVVPLRTLAGPEVCLAELRHTAGRSPQRRFRGRRGHRLLGRHSRHAPSTTRRPADRRAADRAGGRPQRHSAAAGDAGRRSRAAGRRAGRLCRHFAREQPPLCAR